MLALEASRRVLSNQPNTVQANGTNASKNSSSSRCAGLCPSVLDLTCQVRNKCYTTLASFGGGLTGFLALGVASSEQQNGACACSVHVHATTIHAWSLTIVVRAGVLGYCAFTQGWTWRLVWYCCRCLYRALKPGPPTLLPDSLAQADMFQKARSLMWALAVQARKSTSRRYDINHARPALHGACEHPSIS